MFASFLGGIYMIEKLVILFLIFAIYSFLGWVMEVIVVMPKEKKFVNRGFLIGPWCPIYGTGVVLMTLLLTKYENDVIALFIMATLICSILEYITSYVLEKVFKARWWDYSHKKFNIEGRICLQNAAAFGILGLLVIKVINPFILDKILAIPTTTLNIIAFILWLTMFIDFLVSCKVMNKFKKVTFTLKKDNTREITEKVKKELQENSYIYRRLVEAFPNVRETLILKKEEIEKKLKETRDEQKKKIDILQKVFKEKIEKNKIVVYINKKKKELKLKNFKLNERIENRFKAKNK